MNVSFRNTAIIAVLSLIGGAAHAQSSCCGSGSYTGGITNIPVVSGQGSANCCGTVNSQIVAVPGVYVPSNYGTTGVSSNTGSNINTTDGSMYYGGSNYYYPGSYNSSSGGVILGGGGGGYYGVPQPVYNGNIDGLNVQGGAQKVATAEKVVETKVITEIVPIRAVCMDDKNMPHPASRTDANDKLANEFTGEVYRCMAGTHMEAMIGRMVDGKAVFDGGQALTCTKGQALSYKGGNLTCMAQIPAGNCNERSLLRRFGPGIKYVTISRTIKVESQKQAQVQQQQQQMQFRSSMFVDGGVGQGVW